MPDTVDKEVRSRIMSRIRARGNASTELRLRMMLVRAGISEWKMHDTELPGNPDFCFPEAQVAVFVDGCFWHGCPRCGHIPKSNREYWTKKIERNKDRDNINSLELRERGWRVLRIWEHELKDSSDVVGRISDNIYSPLVVSAHGTTMMFPI